MNDEAILAMDLTDSVNHGIVVSRLAGEVAEKLSMSPEFVGNIVQAGLLHDIGKLRIGGYLYGREEGALRIEEIKYVRLHATLGYEILKNQGYNDMILEAVLHHHENYDGTGYPDGLSGDRIPIGARILRVCDVFSALVSERPYRHAYSVEEAIRLLIAEVKNFDMGCFIALTRVVHGKGFEDVHEIIREANEISINGRIPGKVNMNLDFW